MNLTSCVNYPIDHRLTAEETWEKLIKDRNK